MLEVSAKQQRYNVCVSPSRKPEYANAWHRAHRAKDREFWRTYAQLYRLANLDTELERERRSREKHRSKINDRAKVRMREKRAADPAAALDYARNYRAGNRERVAQWDAKKKARRRGAIGSERISAECWHFIKAMHFNRCAYCGAQDEALQMDHIKALSRGGSHTAANIVPACGDCNNSKNARDVFEWIAWANKANTRCRTK